MVKYTLARVGMFVIVAFALTPLHNLLLQLLISAVVTSIASLFLLRRWRNEVAGTLERSMSQRRVEKDRLRSALAGDDELARTREKKA
jgi:membrane protein implicated in regulation of membrane protease activity